MALLGIDIGSTALKAAAFDLEGCQLAAVRLEYRKPSQTADDWWRATLRAVRLLLKDHPSLAREIEAIGLAGRGGTRVFLDRGGRPIALPPDFAPSRQALARAVEIAGSRRGGHGLRLIASVLELQQEHPREFASAARAMAAKDYVLFQLTGHAVTDPASGPDAPSWPVGAAGDPAVGHIRLSEVRQPWTEAGRLRRTVAGQLGLEHDLPVATGAHDGAAATIGAGAARAGAHALTLGTNTVYRILSGEDGPDHNRFWTVLPGLIAYGADITLGGFAVDWVLRMFASSHERLARDAADLAPGCEGVVFLPQLGGRILPEPNPAAAGAFAGLRRNTRHAHLYRSVLEGNAFALRAAREALLAQGLPDGDVYLTGGGTRSPLWRGILAGTFGRAVRWAGVEEGCRGGAIFAGVAAGLWPDAATAMKAMASRPQQLEPGPETQQFQAAYERYVRVREALDHA